MSTVTREVNGRTTTTPKYEYPERVYDYSSEKGAGWLTFAAFMLILGGIFGMIDGVVALSKSSFYVANAHYIFSDLNTWGWIALVVGAVTLFAGFGIFSGSQWARWTGIVVAGLQATAQILMIQAYPFWSLCVFAIDLLVIYALAVYGGLRTRFDA
jgi:hypothetical protein